MIGVFDSGFGGLTVFKELVKELPKHDFIYLGDSARAPYGSHSPGLVYQYTEQAVDYLFRQGCELVILACNTATAAALRKIQQEYLPKRYPDRRVLGVIRPIVEKAVHLTQNGRIAVIGTTVTVNSGAYLRELSEHFALTDQGRRPRKGESKTRPIKLEVFQQACPLLVPLIEEGWERRPETKRILRHYLRPLKDKKPDVLVLGCTHYPILYKDIEAVMGRNCLVLNPGGVVAASFKDYVKRHPEIAGRLSQKGECRLLTTDETDKFEKLGARFLGKRFKAERVSLVVSR